MAVSKVLKESVARDGYLALLALKLLFFLASFFFLRHGIYRLGLQSLDREQGSRGEVLSDCSLTMIIVNKASV